MASSGAAWAVDASAYKSNWGGRQHYLNRISVLALFLVQVPDVKRAVADGKTESQVGLYMK